MAGPAIKGTGVVFSTGAIGGIITGGIGGSGSYLTQSADVALSSDKREIKDNGGTIRSVVYSGQKKTVNLSIVPSGTTVAAARSAMDEGMYDPGTTLVITDDFGEIIGDSYNVDDSRQRRTVDGEAVLDLTLSCGNEGVDTTTLIA